MLEIDSESFSEDEGPIKYQRDSEKIPSFEELIQEGGGFGRFQVFVLLVTSIGLSVNSWISFSLPFFLLYPSFRCEELSPSGDWL
jgi:hypothetical protein